MTLRRSNRSSKMRRVKRTSHRSVTRKNKNRRSRRNRKSLRGGAEMRFSSEYLTEMSEKAYSGNWKNTYFFGNLSLYEPSGKTKNIPGVCIMDNATYKKLVLPEGVVIIPGKQYNLVVRYELPLSDMVFLELDSVMYVGYVDSSTEGKIYSPMTRKDIYTIKLRKM